MPADPRPRRARSPRAAQGAAQGAPAPVPPPAPAIVGSVPRPVPPGLHIVATPIGAARDITLRALDILAGAEVLAAEDTRTLRHLMAIHGIAVAGRPILPYHDHNGAVMRPRLIAALAEGRSVAYASDAGTPLVADPGYRLVRAAIETGHPVHVAPGPSAVLAALTVAGLPTDRFLFAGFLPAQRSARRRAIADLAGIPATIVLFESANRVRETFGDLCEILGPDREAALCRELTKRFETVLRGTTRSVAAALAEREVRGECVIVLDRPPAEPAPEEAVDAALAAALARLPPGAAAAEVAARFGLRRRDLYARAVAAGPTAEGDGE